MNPCDVGRTDRRRTLVLAALVAALAGCGGDGDGGYDGGTGPGGGGTGTGSTSNAIDVRDNSFNPSATTVPVGTTVTWTWRGQSVHDVTFSETVKSPAQSTGSYQRTFTAAGAYDYHCNFHAGMTGRVTVQ